MSKINNLINSKISLGYLLLFFNFSTFSKKIFSLSMLQKSLLLKLLISEWKNSFNIFLITKIALFLFLLNFSNLFFH